MKTYKNLIYKNITLDKCKEIIKKASKYKTKRKSVKKVLDNLDYYAQDLYNMVQTDTYRFGKPNTFKLKEYGKERTITSSPFYPNQCIDYLLLECGFKDIILSKLEFQSFGNVPNKGIHKGLKHITRHLNDGYKYFLKFDIEKYYDNIDKDILYAQISHIVSDKKFLRLTYKILGNCGSRGLPIGSITSQYLALFYIKDFVKWLNHQKNAKQICNYVDDLILSTNKRKLKKLILKIKEELQKYKLKLNKKTIIYSLDERYISILGFRLKKDIIMLRKKILFHLYRTKNEKSLNSLVSWLNYTTCYKLKRRYTKCQQQKPQFIELY